MKKIIYSGLAALLFSCSTAQQENAVIPVSLPPEGTGNISWFDTFSDMEMIPLQGENRPLFSLYSGLIVRDNIYYVIDPAQTRQVHRFSKDGTYLNSIGAFGRGPNEYLDLTDVLIDDQGNVSVYSQQANALLTYTPDGTLLERKELTYPTERFMSHQGFNYHYIGTAGKTQPMPYRLYVTDAKGQTVGEHLPTPKAPALPNNHTFSLNGDNLYLCPNEGNDIYELQKGKIEKKYSFDFGEYNLPAEYYECENLLALMTFLQNKTVVYKLGFWENKDCSIIDGFRQANFEGFSPFYGIQDRKKGSWKWVNYPIDGSIFFRYIDHESAYFIADPEMLKQQPGLTERFPRLNTLNMNDGMVILRAKTKSVQGIS